MDEGLLAASVTTLRLISGWACCSFGLLGLAMGIDTEPGTTDGSYLLFHVVLVLTGLVLLSLGFLRRRPGRAAYVTAGSFTLAGFVVSALPRTGIVCCLLTYPVRHGFPFTFFASGAGSHLSIWHALIDLFFWLCVGLFVLVGIALPGRRKKHPITHSTHAEQRAAAPEARTDEEQVRRDGGVPGRRQP